MSQYDDYMRDYRAVVAGTKPAMIVEKRKSKRAWRAISTLAHCNLIPHISLRLADSTGLQQPAEIIGKQNHNVTSILSLLQTRETFSRADFQIAMGLSLGYPKSDCESFTESRLSLTCGCELCGGQTPESRLDDACEAKRTQYYAA